MQKIRRLRELDFLRGIAILLVLFRHRLIFQFTKNMGWIGVDLFFVLSGFLVSGLLFKEYAKFGDIKPGRFLIRRGFKIYPIYYLTYVIYLYFTWRVYPPVDLHGVFYDLIFVQNYAWLWGYAYSASWSLAVEEHFYFGFSILLWLGLSRKIITLKTENTDLAQNKFRNSLFAVLAICLIIRIISNILHLHDNTRLFTMTHLRIDSLLAGVIVSYYYYYRLDELKSFFAKTKNWLFIVALLGLSWTPFIDPIPSFFVRTIGFTLLYISFGITLVYFLLLPDINVKLDTVFSKRVVNMISKIGYCSYSIYIIHSLVNSVTNTVQDKNHLYFNHYLYFIMTSAVSILLGILMTDYIEKYFLQVRDTYYPNRAL